MERPAEKTVHLAAQSRRDPISRLGRFAARHLARKPARLVFDRPVVSVTFDDAPDSAVRNGARLLANAGKRGTFYLSSGLCDARFGPWIGYGERDVAALIEDGHEIGCHTASHCDMQTLDAARIEAECTENRRWFGARDGRIELINFAYPYGSTGVRQKRAVAGRFMSCRGVRPGLNHGWTDLAHLFAVPLCDGGLDTDSLRALLRETAVRCAWLIFFTHDVEDRPTRYGCSPRLLREAIGLAIAGGCEVAPVRDALAAGLRQSS